MKYDVKYLIENKNAILAAGERKGRSVMGQIKLNDMSVSTQIWFNVLVGEVIDAWNNGNCAVSGAELLDNTKSRFNCHFTQDEWKAALTTLCIKNMKGAMNFLLYSDAEDIYLVNYPEISLFLSKPEFGSYFDTLKLFFGFDIQGLRKPSKEEVKWFENMN